MLVMVFLTDVYYKVIEFLGILVYIYSHVGGEIVAHHFLKVLKASMVSKKTKRERKRISTCLGTLAMPENLIPCFLRLTLAL